MIRLALRPVSRRFAALLLAPLLTGGLAAAAPESAPPKPYFVSIKVDKAYMREGPSDSNRIKWVYQRKGLPLEVLASFEVWRRVKDMDGEIGWIHTALLSRDRTAIVVGTADAPVHRRADASSDIVAQAKPGALGRLIGCAKLACQVKFEAAQGWVERSRLWGVHDGDEY
jgi:SH3-like domain-containing protein